MNKKDKLDRLVAAVKEYGGTVHGDWRDEHGISWLDVEFTNMAHAVICLSNFSDLTDGTQPRDPIHSFSAAVVVQIPLESSHV